MTARLPHGSGSDVVVVLAEVATFLENSPACQGRQPGYKHTQWLSTGMHVERFQPHPSGGRLPVPTFENRFHLTARRAQVLVLFIKSDPIRRFAVKLTIILAALLVSLSAPAQEAPSGGPASILVTYRSEPVNRPAL